MVSIVVLSDDDVFVEQIRQTTDLQVFRHVEEEAFRFVNSIHIIDATTINLTVKKFNEIVPKPLYQVIIADHDFDVTDFVEEISDIWYKPLNMVFLRKRINNASIIVDANMHIANYIGYMNFESRAPLNNIMGYSELLLLGKLTEPLSENQYEFVSNIYQSARRLNETIQDLRDDSRILLNQFLITLERCEIKKIIEKLQSLSQYGISKDYIESFPEFIINIPDNLPSLQTDSSRLLQVFTILLKNAKRSEKPIILNAYSDEAVICFTVTDFFKNTYSLAFDDSDNFILAFSHSTKLLKHIIKAHGGEMWLEQDEDSSTFHFTIPIAQEDSSDGE